jgi:O-antigen/teichoic acid export membrane protein
VAAAKICGIPFIFLFVKAADDGWRFALITSMSAVGGGVACLCIALQWQLVERWSFPRWSEIRDAFVDAWHYFITVASAAAYTAANPLLLGLVSSNHQVAIFGAADRVRMMCVAPLQPISTAYYPALSRLFAQDPKVAIQTMKRLSAVTTLGMTIISILLFIFAPVLVEILMGPKYGEAVPVLRVMALAPLLVGLNAALGVFTMLPMGMKKQVSRIIMVCGAANLALISYFGAAYGALGGAMAIVCVEAMVMISQSTTLYLVSRRNEKSNGLEAP